MKIYFTEVKIMNNTRSERALRARNADYSRGGYTNRNQDNNNENVYKKAIFMLQIMICIGLFTGALLIRAVDTSFANDIKQKITKALSENIPISELYNKAVEKIGNSEDEIGEEETKKKIGDTNRKISTNTGGINTDWLNPVDGIITSDFGDRSNPISEDEELHNGVDIAVEEGTAIVAVADGVVVKVDNINTYGNYIKYKVDNDYIVLYAHCSQILVKEGDLVKQGQILAEAGSTGMSTGPHVHYSIWYKGELLNPKLFLKR